jgi:hypothetical protein
MKNDHSGGMRGAEDSFWSLLAPGLRCGDSSEVLLSAIAMSSHTVKCSPSQVEQHVEMRSQVK